MALTQLTKIDGGGISTTSDYRVGVITATKFVGPIEGVVTGSLTGTATTAINAQGLIGTPNITVGILTASSANFTGNVTIGGTLTYEDVTNIDSVGIITAQKDIHVGAGVSAVGVGTFGSLDISGDIDVDGHTNLDNVSIAGDIDVDGHTNLDNVSIAGITTGGGFKTAGTSSDAGATNGFTAGRINIYDNASHNIFRIGTSPSFAPTVWQTSAITFTANSFSITNTQSTREYININNSTGILKLGYGAPTADHGFKFETSGKGIKVGTGVTIETNGQATFSGITTFSDEVNIIQGKKINFGNINGTQGHIYFDGSTTRFQTNAGLNIGAPVVSLKSANLGEVMLDAAYNGAVRLFYDYSTYNTPKLVTTATGVTIDGTAVAGGLDISGDIDVDGHTNLDNVSIAGVSTFSDNIRIADSKKLLLGNLAAGDCQFIHDGNDTFIQNKTGDLKIANNVAGDVGGDIIIQALNGEDSIKAIHDGAVELYWNGGLRFSTDNQGVLLPNDKGICYGDIGTKISGLNGGGATRGLFFMTNSGGKWQMTGDGHFIPSAVGSYDIGSTSAEIGNVYVADDKSVYLGNGQDIRLLYDSSGSTSFTIDSQAGYMYINSDALRLNSRTSSWNYLRGDKSDGVVKLYKSNSQRLATSDTGITVTGEVAASQDYPDFEPVLNFNFAGSSTQLDPRLLYRRSGVASFYDANGLVKLVGENTPRFDHDPISRKNKGILIEHSRTNLFLFGTTPGDNWTGSKAGTFEENTTETTAPDGTFTATKWTFTSTDPYLYQTTTLNANTTYTMSMWVKAGTNMAGDWVQFRIGGAPYSAQADSIIPADGTWRRITYTRTVGGSAENSASVGFEPQTSPSGNPAVGDVIYIWGAQLEVGGYASSFIPTYGRSQTRGADLLAIDGDDSTALSDAYNDQEGTLVVEYHNVITDGSYVATIDDGSNNNRFGISNSNSSQGISVSGGTSQGQLDNGTPIVGATNKMAHAYKLNDRGLSLNGNDATQDNGFALPTGIRFIWIGCRSGSYDFLGSTISRFMYYTKRLPNSQLKLLTSQ